LNYLTGWFLITQEHIRKGGGPYLPKGCLDNILKETMVAFGLEKLKLKKTIYKRARQHCLALYPHRHLHMLCHHNYITMEEFKNIVERLVNWDLIHLLNFDKSLSTSSLSMAWLSQVLITFDLQLEDM
jgi:hypothetical protein